MSAMATFIIIVIIIQPTKNKSYNVGNGKIQQVDICGGSESEQIQEWLGKASEKKYGIIWEFFPT